MANIKSKEKRNRQTKKITERNKSFKSKMKTAIKKAEETKDEKDINAAVKLVDSALSKNILKKNKASRMKSQLHSLKKADK